MDISANPNAINGFTSCSACQSFRRLHNLFLQALIAFNFAFPIVAEAQPNQCADVFSNRSAVLETQHGAVVITEEAAIQLLRDRQTLKSAMRLRGAEKMRALLDYAKQKTQSRVNVGLTFVNYATAVFLTTDIVSKLTDAPEASLTTAALIPATWIATDAVSSVYHYFLDNWVSPRNRLFGSAARAFRKHHEVPNNLSETGFIQNVSAFSTLMAPLYVATALASPHLASELETQALVALLLFSHGTEIHRQAHLSNPNKFVRWFQKRRILLDSEVHNQHHIKPIDSDYGIINGVTNRATTPLYERLNKILYKATGRLPQEWIQTPNSIPETVMEDLLADLKSVPQELIVSAATSKHSDARVDELLRLWIENVGTANGLSNE